MEPIPRSKEEVLTYYNHLIEEWRMCLNKGMHSAALAIGSQLHMLCWSYHLPVPTQ